MDWKVLRRMGVRVKRRGRGQPVKRKGRGQVARRGRSLRSRTDLHVGKRKQVRAGRFCDAKYVTMWLSRTDPQVKKAHKLAVKEEKREKRKNKVPKHVKKRKEKILKTRHAK